MKKLLLICGIAILGMTTAFASPQKQEINLNQKNMGLFDNIKAVPLEDQEGLQELTKANFKPILKHAQFSLNAEKTGVDANFTKVYDGLLIFSAVTANLAMVNALELLHPQLHELQDAIKSRDGETIVNCFNRLSVDFHELLDKSIDNYEISVSDLDSQGYS